MTGLLGPSEIRALSERLDVVPTKRWGQNFMVDAGTVTRIAGLAGLGPDDHVVEVGPGLGSLTLALLATGARVTAIEIDPRLADALPETIAGRDAEAARRLTVITSDAMKVDALDAPPTALVANLPYNVSVPVILHLLETFPTLNRAVVLVQAEVADRIVAPPGSRTYGIPSAKVAWYAAARRAGDVGRAVFWPVPRVDSALVRIDRREPPSTTASRERVFEVIDAAFAQRRKGLRGALSGIAGSSAVAESALLSAGIEPLTRGERLDIGQFTQVAEALDRPSSDTVGA